MSHYRAAMLDAGRKYWTDLLAKHGNNVSAAAREAGVARQNVYKYVKHYGVPFRRPDQGKWNRATALQSWPRGREMRL